MVSRLKVNICEVHLVMVRQVHWARPQSAALYPPKSHIVPPTGYHSRMNKYTRLIQLPCLPNRPTLPHPLSLLLIPSVVKARYPHLLNASLSVSLSQHFHIAMVMHLVGLPENHLSLAVRIPPNATQDRASGRKTEEKENE